MTNFGMPFEGPCDPCSLVVLPGVGEWVCENCETVLVSGKFDGQGDEERKLGNWDRTFQKVWAAHVQSVLDNAINTHPEVTSES